MDCNVSHLPFLKGNWKLGRLKSMHMFCQLVCSNVRFGVTADLKRTCMQTVNIQKLPALSRRILVCSDRFEASKFLKLYEGARPCGQHCTSGALAGGGGADNTRRAGELAVQTMNQLWMGILQPNRGPKMISG